MTSFSNIKILQVKDIVQLHRDTCTRHSDLPMTDVTMSIDGVNECNSSSRSLQVVSLRFNGCKEIYSCLISRPEVFQKKASKAAFEVYIESIIEELIDCDLRLDKLVCDAPERASARKQKQHGGYYCCDLCVANPENHRIPGKQASKFLNSH